ncbi:putative proline rich signal peptide protein [Rhodoferax ferrireducens T118]|uniref:Putative proline rich signal peptide protein n=1 Tax=Albidiferax ferrireducens (strain ATCC BAA-621 / DSM 15236 / T118) TaxID=338969 RepID=Q21SG0_ALBFT|nr:putative proline rich signal peptide protein [Rhodoferax ferrireducens T118]
MRNARLDLIGLLACTCLVWGSVGPARAQTRPAEISSIKVERAGDAIVLSAGVQFELSAAVEDALLKGVAMIFVAEADILRERWYWTNKKVVHAERHMRLAYQPLTRRWRLNVASGQITNAGLGLALNQNFDTLPDALAAVQRLSRWKIAEVSDIDPEQHHLVEFRFGLDVFQLPRPLQIGTLGQTDWDISVFSRRALTLETAP